MAKDLYDIEELAHKWAEGTITDTERAYFEQWYARQTESPEPFMGDPDTRDRMMNRLLDEIAAGEASEQEPAYRLPSWLKQLAAVITIALLSFGLYFTWKNDPATVVKNTAGKPKAGSGIAPGSNKAILTLSDGRQINLDDSKNGTLSQQGNTRVIKLAGKVTFDADQGKAPVNTYNLLSTPKGGKYMLELSDGTIVWLNAGSSLRFPTIFHGKERVVELTGEGYFEVAKNKEMPFYVKARGTTVKVLGTHFNVMAYPDEPTIETTLLEGSVQVTGQHDSKLLLPGQQARVNDKIAVVAADLEQTMAWKNGMFYFRRTGLQAIMKQLERWYDIDADLGTMPGKMFNGKISRNVNLSEVIDMLELTSGLRFKVEGRRIYVMD